MGFYKEPGRKRYDKRRQAQNSCRNHFSKTYVMLYKPMMKEVQRLNK